MIKILIGETCLASNPKGEWRIVDVPDLAIVFVPTCSTQHKRGRRPLNLHQAISADHGICWWGS